MSRKPSYEGSNFDDFLAEEGILEQCTTAALMAVAADQLKDAIRRKRVSKKVLAARMNTSRAQVDRLLEPKDNANTTIATFARAASALGMAVRMELVST
jgi:antitoxin HicB